MYLGYILLGATFFLFFLYKLIQKRKKMKKSEINLGSQNDDVSVPISKNNSNSNENKSNEYSTSSTDSPVISSSLVVLKSPVKRSMKFDDLLKCPAELLGKGKHGNVYKVMAVDGSVLVVRRIKEWMISSEEFHKRMEMINKARHKNVLPLVAFYCSKQEKLVVYEFQLKGSLLNLIHGSQFGRTFDWSSRLNMAAGIAEGMSFVHRELQAHGIGHGNLKSSNIIMNNTMDPCISELGLMTTDQTKPTISTTNNSTTMNNNVFKKDVYDLGIILLELLTGKLVQNNGADLAKWVNSVVREEWTVEVFDKALVAEGASEERMVHLLQIALKCVSSSFGARPTMSQVSSMINGIKEEEDRSGVSDLL
ncbi:probable inactive receptor kinase At2g26730 [Dioscorea cayenensis subsp. rotundata]|uniref:Probable inactive receptor kinase At2g26730 n=1 Tax=Dioscorea cayennensis subsp. rotundata TaxID=55577 RepID=A0AB40B1C3_DIOCR|nr:probable inactive receptor kinase At2g26730 [Dioscorea cayenensis subsp. rotundata]